MESINILDFFRNFTSLKEEKKIGNEFYFAKPGQKTGSIAVNLKTGFFYDHSEGIGGGIVKAKQLYHNGIDLYSSYIPHEEKIDINNMNIEIKSISSVKNANLLNFYLNERCLPKEYLHLVSEIQYNFNNKSYYTLGWINENNGINTQNSIMKRILNDNGITFINNHSSIELAMFESYFDYLAYLKHTNNLKTDVIVLNSTSMVSHINIDLSKYKIINLYLDNDMAGNKCTKIIIEKYPQAEDNRFYEKDYNQHIIDEQNKNNMNKSIFLKR